MSLESDSKCIVRSDHTVAKPTGEGSRMTLEYEMTYAETIEGPVGPIHDSPFGERLCWQVTQATLRGPRVNATLAMPGIDWIRVGSDGIRRQDSRAQLIADDDELILLSYDLAVIRSSETFLAALVSGEPTGFDDQYMRIAPRFDVGAGRYEWLRESLFLGRGRVTGPKAIEYQLYRVT